MAQILEYCPRRRRLVQRVEVDPRRAAAQELGALRRRVAVSSTLVASLELARTGTLTLDQDAPWMSIRVQHRDDRHCRIGDSGPLAQRNIEL